MPRTAPSHLRTALLVSAAGAGGLCAQDSSSAEASPANTARALCRELELPGRAMAAAHKLTALGDAAIPHLHMVLRDPRPQVQRYGLWVVSGLAGGGDSNDERASLETPVRALLRNENEGVALLAVRALVSLQRPARTLITDYQANEVLAVAAEEETELVASHGMAMGARPLAEGHWLITAYGEDRVVELDANGDEVWTHGGLNNPSAAQRLGNGNTLIAESGAHRVVEVNVEGEVVWKFADTVHPIDAERLPNGNTLIGSYHSTGAIEVTPDGDVVWSFDNENVRDVDVLLDDTYLIACTDDHKIVNLDKHGEILREWQLDFAPNDAELLPNGHLLAGGDGKVVELDRSGAEVWTHRVGYAGSVTQIGARPSGGGEDDPKGKGAP